MYFLHKPKRWFLFLNFFLKTFGLCLQLKTSDKDLGYLKHQRLDGLTFTMHEKRRELSSRCLSQMI